MIGSGKSVCSKHLSEILGFKLIDEFDPNDEVFSFMLNQLYGGNTQVAFMLQSGFLNNTFIRYNYQQCNVVTDRDLAEHFIFANMNIKNEDQLASYNGMFWNFYQRHWKPDLYIILDCSWSIIEYRILKRGRPAEVDNFTKNICYFKELNSNYIKKLKGFCDLMGIKSWVINAEEDGFYENIFKESNFCNTYDKSNKIYFLENFANGKI